MKRKNQFEHLSSPNARINILLEHFCFFHRPVTPDIHEDTDSKYINKPNPVHQLCNWIKYNEADSGSYLVTGYRGAGKSSFVGKLLKELQKEEKTTHVRYVPLFVNFGQENIKETEILRIVVKRLLGALLEQNPVMRLYYSLKHYTPLLVGLFAVTTAFSYYILGKENIYTYLFLSAMLLTLITVQTCASIHSEVRAIVKLRNLASRLNASVQVESGGLANMEWEGLRTPLNTRRSRNIQQASPQEMEYDLIEVLDLLRKSDDGRRIVIVFDELDKTDSTRRSEHSESLPEFEKLSIRPEQKVSSRTRKQEVLRIIANMKFFLSSAKAYFIFIAGREMYEAYLADMSDRDFSISSIFSGVINVDSFLTSSRNTNNTNQMTEQFVCKQLLPGGIKELIEASNDHRYDRKNIYSLKNYYLYRTNHVTDFHSDERNTDGTPDKNRRISRIWNEVLTLYHFISYLTYISNGSPKKMTLFFEKNIRRGDYLRQEGKTDEIYEYRNGRLAPCTRSENRFFLSFGYYTQEKINFIHYLTYPIMQSIINRSNLYGDKLLVSSSFLISHIFKLHNNGFSWRNLEQTPELLEINKTPEIREYIGSIIDFMNHTHLTTIACGLFHYKFPMRIAEEISYHSKISGEVSSMFNFSLDEMQSIKEHYIRVLKSSGTETGTTKYTRNSIRHSLGDIYMLEENYSDAIREYEKCMEKVLPEINVAYRKDGRRTQLLNDISFLNRTMLKLGLAHEKRRTDNSAFILYEELIRILREHARKDSVLFDNMRTLHLALIARLYVLEKIDTTGIRHEHLKETCDIFYEIFKKRSHSLTEADFYRKLGDVLYYKNQQFRISGKEYTARSFYNRSLCLALNISGFHLRCDNARCVRLCNEALGVKKKLEMVEKVNFQKTASRDNYIYHMALSLEDLGHVELSAYKKPYLFHSGFIRKFAGAVENSSLNIDFHPGNNIERAILYYWTASRLYNISCERSLSTKCYKEIAYSLLAYVQQLEKSELKKMNGDMVLTLVRNLGGHFLISQYRQYEHINLSEMDVLQWTKGLEMFRHVDSSDLSIAPDVEELLYIYYRLRLHLYRIDACKERKRNIEALASFYRSDILTGRRPCCTLSSTVLTLKLKSEYNEWMLARLLGDVPARLERISFRNITDYIERGITEELVRVSFPELAVIKNGQEQKTGLNLKLDLLEFLISDGLFCLSRVLELIIPLRNTTLFNNSFKAGIYLHLLRFTYLYKLLYCYYYYGSCRQDDREIDNFLKSRGIVLPIAAAKPADNYTGRRIAFFRRVKDATRKSNPANTHLSFLAENAIHYFTKARQMHFQGKSYQETIRNLFFLDDDLNNDTLQFHMALERFNIASKTLHDAEQGLKNRYSDNPAYHIDEYFNQIKNEDS